MTTQGQATVTAAGLEAAVAASEQGAAGLYVPRRGWRRRDLPDPQVADSTYTGAAITPSTAANSTPQLATAVQVPPATGPYRYVGASDFTFGVGVPDSNYYLPTSKVPHAYGTPQSSWGMEFVTDTSRLEVRFKYISAATMYRLTIDGRKVTELMQAMPGALNAGSGYRLLLDLGSAAERRWRLDLYTCPFGGVYLEPAYSMSRPPVEGGRMVVLGDSVSDGSNGNTGGGGGSWFRRFARLIGCTDDWDQAKGSTGYTTGGPGMTFGERAAPDVVAYSPDRVVVWGGFNDTAASRAQLQAAAADTLATLLDGLPDAEVLMLGCWTPTESPATTLQDIDGWLREVARDHAVPFISPISGSVYADTGDLLDEPGPWITAGNKAGYIYATDGSHPTNGGHAHIARRVYDAYRTILQP